MKKPSVILLLLLITPHCLLCRSQEIEIEDLVLLVFEDGYVEVSYLVRLTGEEVEVELPLIGEPEEGFMVITDEKSLLLNYEIKDEKVIVESLGAELVNVTYHTKMITKMEAGVWTINITSPSNRTTIRLPKNSIIMGLSSIPVSISKEDGRTVLVFDVKGLIWTSYVIELETPTPSPTSSSGEPSPTPPKTEIREESFYTWFVPVLAGFVFILFLLIISLKRPRKVVVKIEELPYVDRLIIEELKARGGSAFQSELIRVLELPKTTVWRHLKGLEEEGLIEIKKIRGMNHIRLRELK